LQEDREHRQHQHAQRCRPHHAAPGKAWSDVIVPTAEGGLVMGNPNAPVKMVEYGSLSCPHCAKLAQDGMDKIVNTYERAARFPMNSAASPSTRRMPLTVLVRCAPHRGDLWPDRAGLCQFHGR
jgi:protein-disulfide isomerase